MFIGIVSVIVAVCLLVSATLTFIKSFNLYDGEGVVVQIREGVSSVIAEAAVLGLSILGWFVVGLFAHFLFDNIVGVFV